MRADAGYVTVAAPAESLPVLEVRLLEAVKRPLEEVDAAVERARALALGPGLGRDEGSFALAQTLVERIEQPLLVDADGLNALAAADLAPAARRSAPLVLTPHAGELARLLGTQSRAVEAARLSAARDAAERCGAVVLLKGDDTLVAGPKATELAVSRGGSPALATAGTGDVLSGVIAAFIARGLDVFEAACAGVYAHARAGREAERRLGAESVLAGDVIEALPAALRGG
jgi:NAD(P)H-hydrate epimerase